MVKGRLKQHVSHKIRHTTYIRQEIIMYKVIGLKRCQEVFTMILFTMIFLDTKDLGQNSLMRSLAPWWWKPCKVHARDFCQNNGRTIDYRDSTPEISGVGCMDSTRALAPSFFVEMSLQSLFTESGICKQTCVHCTGNCNGLNCKQISLQCTPHGGGSSIVKVPGDVPPARVYFFSLLV